MYMPGRSGCCLSRTQADVTLAVLAGGESRRMGSPKTHLQICGRPILEYLLNVIQWPGPRMLVTAPGRQHPPGCERFDREVCDPTAAGPLRGILTALENMATDHLLVITADMPVIRTEHLCWLLQELSGLPGLSPSPGTPGEGRGEGSSVNHKILATEKRPSPYPSPGVPGEGTRVEPALNGFTGSPRSLAVMTRRIIGGVEMIEPFPFACSRNASVLIESHLKQGKRSVQSLLELPGFQAVDAPPEWPADVWTNLNSPQDYQKFIASHPL